MYTMLHIPAKIPSAAFDLAPQCKTTTVCLGFCFHTSSMLGPMIQTGFVLHPSTTTGSLTQTKNLHLQIKIKQISRKVNSVNITNRKTHSNSLKIFYTFTLPSRNIYSFVMFIIYYLFKLLKISLVIVPAPCRLCLLSQNIFVNECYNIPNI